MGWQLGQTGQGHVFWLRSARLLVVLALAAPILLTAAGCHRNRIPRRPESSEESVPLLPIVRLPETQQELAARLAVNDQVLRTSRLGPTFGWRMDSEGSSAHGWRWRHHRVESFRQDLQASTLEQRQAILLLAVATPNKSVGANALIALSREGNREALRRLLPIVDSTETPTTIRCAALETAALADGQGMIPHLTQLIDGALAEVKSVGAPQTDHALVAEALRNLAVYRSVEEDPRFGLVFAHPADVVQLAALEAWETPGGFPPPPQMLSLFSSREPKIRAAALRVLAMRPISGSYDDVAGMMRDPSYQVQQAAAQAILALNTPQGVHDLQSKAAGGAELVRASIAKAFSQYGHYDAAYAMADDKSWRVRTAVAEAVESDDRPAAHPIAAKLIEDRSPQVQAAAIASVSNWPVERGGELLLAAMKSNAFATREAARVALSENWPSAEVFSSSAPPAQRQETIADLEHSFQHKFFRFGQHKNDTGAMDFGTAMQRLKQAEVAQRNSALDNVVSAIDEYDLSASQGKALAKTLSEWGTSTPWAAVIQALDGQDLGRAALLRPALAGDHAPALYAACDHLAAYPTFVDTRSKSPRPSARQHRDNMKNASDFMVELRRLSRSNDAKLAAKSLRALAATGDATQIELIAQSLSAGDRQLRAAAAIGLVHLNDARGLPALERLASEPNVQVRRALLQQLEQSRDPRLAYVVVRLLNDRPDVGRLALQTLNKWAEAGILPTVAAPEASFFDQRIAWQTFARQGVAPDQIPTQDGVIAAGYDSPVDQR